MFSGREGGGYDGIALEREMRKSVFPGGEDRRC